MGKQPRPSRRGGWLLLAGALLLAVLTVWWVARVEPPAVPGPPTAEESSPADGPAPPTPPPGPAPEPPGAPDAGAGDSRGPQPDPTAVAVELGRVVAGLEQPVHVAWAGDGSDRMFIVEQTGRVRVFAGGRLEAEPYLDLRDRVTSGGERGLLSIAFHPDFAQNGQVYVSYTGRRGESVLARYRVADPASGRPDPAAEEILLTVPQPYANHNGGLILFGPDGYLYFGLGDGGGAGDPEGNGQNPETLLGGLLRLDVDGAGGDLIPDDNPFVGRPGRDELWAIGLRNPWRFSFDRRTGDLYLADVGQSRREEINFVPAGSGAGRNFGWNIWEGSLRYRDGEAVSEVTFPVAEYATGSEGCSVTGGYVYRGRRLPQLEGVYLYSDYCAGTLWALWRDGDSWRSAELLQTDLRVTSFGEDADGELYIVDHRSSIFRLVPR